jgi:predicted CoA-binding protein
LTTTPSPSYERTWRPQTARTRRELLESARTIAIVGASDKPERDSYKVAEYLRENSDYTVWYVNPNIDSVLGERTYASLADLPESPDIVDVFRRPSDLPAVGDEAMAAGAKVLWLQLGLYNAALAEKATEAGLIVIQDRCLKIEHQRYFG